MKDDLQRFRVHHEREGFIEVWAANAEAAKEEYYKSLESIMGHTMRICTCYHKKAQPIDRSKVIRITRVEGPLSVGV